MVRALTMERMATIDERQAFSDRLNRVLDAEGLPEKGSGRHKRLAKNWGLTENGVRKWLEGEGIPETTRLIEMARRYNVNFEWLVTGRDPVTLQPEDSIVRGALLPRSPDQCSPSAQAVIDAVLMADRQGVPAHLLKIVADLVRNLGNPCWMPEKPSNQTGKMDRAARPVLAE